MQFLLPHMEGDTPLWFVDLRGEGRQNEEETDQLSLGLFFFVGSNPFVEAYSFSFLSSLFLFFTFWVSPH